LDNGYILGKIFIISLSYNSKIIYRINLKIYKHYLSYKKLENAIDNTFSNV